MYIFAKSNLVILSMLKIYSQLVERIFLIRCDLAYTVVTLCFRRSDYFCIQNSSFGEKSQKNWRQNIWALCKTNLS